MGYVYGDSTPFPYDIDFIELIRNAVHCGVQLLGAQQTIVTATERIAATEHTRTADRARMDRVSEAVRQSMSAYVGGGPERQVRVAQRVLEASRGAIEQEIGSIEAFASEEVNRARATMNDARMSTFRALESFIRRNDMPGTEVALRLYPEDETYAGRTTVTTPFGVEAVFEVAIPLGHDWTRARRVMEIAVGTEVHVPSEAGWLQKRIEPRAVKLDKLYVSEVAASSAGSRVTLLRSLRQGPGYEFEITSGLLPRAVLHDVDEGGHVTGGKPLVLEDDDAEHVFRLWNGILGSTQDLLTHRSGMASGTFDGHNLRDLDDPQSIVARMVEVLAPTVREIERRSGTPRELVLRRDLGEGRRQESYIQKSELMEMVQSVPSSMRSVFNGFELAEVQRVSLSKRHEPEEVSAELMIDDDSVAR